MDRASEDLAVRLLSEAAETGVPLAALPPASWPATPAEALAMQDRIVAASGKAVAGWKVATMPDGTVTYGAIYAEDCYDSPAALTKQRYPLMGVEGEVAFRFLRDLPAGPPLLRQELEPMLAPFPAFEIVATRFLSYADTPAIVRLADRMSNGGMVIGEAEGVPVHLGALAVRLTLNGEAVVDQVGGHSRGDPLLPAIEFINALRPTQAFAAGQFITAGTFTGMCEGNIVDVWELSFAGLGQVRLTIL